MVLSHRHPQTCCNLQNVVSLFIIKYLSIYLSSFQNIIIIIIVLIIRRFIQDFSFENAIIINYLNNYLGPLKNGELSECFLK